MLVVVLGGCNAPTPREAARPDSARQAFARTVDSLLLDTERHEISGVLLVKIPNPNRDDESPLADERVPHPTEPGPHTTDGVMHAEVGALRDLLGRELPVEIDTARHRVYVGRTPEVLIMGIVGTGLLEGHADGIVPNLNVRRLPDG